MIKYEQFVEMFKDTETFEKAFPPGFRFKYIDGDTWQIVAYIIDDQFKRKDPKYFTHLVVIKSWSKYKQRWCYRTDTTFCFFSTMELCNRGEKRKKTKEYKEICKKYGLQE